MPGNDGCLCVEPKSLAACASTSRGDRIRAWRRVRQGAGRSNLAEPWRRVRQYLELKRQEPINPLLARALIYIGRAGGVGLFAKQTR